MANQITLGGRSIGFGSPSYIAAEIGINHNGDIEVAKRLIDAAKLAGCDAVKFQKRSPELAVPIEMRDMQRDTPWGVMSYMEYRHRVEFDKEQYVEIDRYCRERSIDWFASVWDQEAVDFLEQFNPVALKVPSAAITDLALLDRVRESGRVVVLSTGMSTSQQIADAVETIGLGRLILVHTTSTYPCPPDELNLRVIQTLRDRFGCPVGYSGHEVGLQTTLAAVALGADFIERHITLDRSMWGSDQAASVEPAGFIRLVRDIRIVEQALGDGVKRVYESERPIMRRLRRSEQS